MCRLSCVPHEILHTAQCDLGDTQGLTVEEAKLPIFQTIKASAADVCRIIVELPLHCLAMLVIAALNSVMQQGLLNRIAEDGSTFEINFYVIICSLPILIVSAPIFVAFHRFIIVGDKMSFSDIWGGRALVITYCVVSLCVSIVNCLGNLLRDVSGHQLDSPYAWMSLIVGLVFSVSIIVFTIRISLVYPAIAVDRDDVSLRWSLRNTKGMFWRVSANCIISSSIFLPFVVLERLASGFGFGILSITILTLSVFFGMLLYPANLSEIYLWYSRKGFVDPDGYVCK